GNTHSSRIPITASVIQTANETSRPTECSDSARKDSGNCRPIRMKTKPFSKNSTMFQNGPACSRVLEVVISGTRQPRNRPAVTTASTPETPIRSAARKATKGVRKDTVTSTGGSSTYLWNNATSHPSNNPMPIPPAATTTNSQLAFASEKDLLTTAMIAKR